MFDDVQFTGRIDLGSIVVAVLSLVAIYRTYLAIKVSNLKAQITNNNELIVCKALLADANKEIAQLKERLSALENPNS
jgi:acyl-CoA hydrolase